MQSQLKSGGGPTPAADDKLFCLTPPRGDDPVVSKALPATTGLLLATAAAAAPALLLLTTFRAEPSDGMGITPLLRTPTVFCCWLLMLAATLTCRLINCSEEETDGACVGTASTAWNRKLTLAIASTITKYKVFPIVAEFCRITGLLKVRYVC
jgi:hypothetical protein